MELDMVVFRTRCLWTLSKWTLTLNERLKLKPGYHGHENDKSHPPHAPQLLYFDIAALVLPMYMDLSVFVIGAISKLMKKDAKPDTVDDNEEVGKLLAGTRYTHCLLVEVWHWAHRSALRNQRIPTVVTPPIVR